VLLDGEPVPLTGVEFKVLRYLVSTVTSVDREELRLFLDSFETPGAAARSIDVYVGRIRRKLRGNAGHAMATVRGGGYRFMLGTRATVRGPAEYSI
jgi:two-component system OmpR family response regulator